MYNILTHKIKTRFSLCQTLLIAKFRIPHPTGALAPAAAPTAPAAAPVTAPAPVLAPVAAVN